MDIRKYKDVPLGIIANMIGVKLPECVTYMDTLASVRLDEEKYFNLIAAIVARLQG